MSNQDRYYPTIQLGTYEKYIEEELPDLKEFTVICVIAEAVPEAVIKRYASALMQAGCRDFGFCGAESEKWHQLFDEVDIDRTEDSKDISRTWTIIRDKDIPDALLISNEDVLILCDDQSLLQEIEECCKYLCTTDQEKNNDESKSKKP